MFKEMPQRHEQLRRVSDPTLVERFVNVINDHAADLLAAMNPGLSSSRLQGNQTKWSCQAWPLYAT